MGDYKNVIIGKVTKMHIVKKYIAFIKDARMMFSKNVVNLSIRHFHCQMKIITLFCEIKNLFSINFQTFVQI